jgi:hypothetical protein
VPLALAAALHLTFELAARQRSQPPDQ